MNLGNNPVSASFWAPAMSSGSSSRRLFEQAALELYIVAEVTVSGSQQRQVTDENGDYVFRKLNGTFTVNMPLSGYPGFFNADLEDSFDPTTDLTLAATVPPDAPGNDFGFSPRSEEIILTDSKSAGKTLDQLNLPNQYGCYATGLMRASIELPLDTPLPLQKGDRLEVIGESSNLKRLADEFSLDPMLSQCRRFCDHPTFDSAGAAASAPGCSASRSRANWPTRLPCRPAMATRWCAG